MNTQSHPIPAADAAHTPTPWKTRRVTYGFNDLTRHHRIERQNGDLIAVVPLDIDTHGVPQKNITSHLRKYSANPAHSAEDAAFIVRACNSHAALVEALERVMTEWDRLAPARVGLPEPSAFAQARAALSLARGDHS